MTGRSKHHDKIQDYLDGLLFPAEEAAVRDLIDTSPEAKRHHDELAAVCSMLDRSIDVEPPAGLLPGIFAAIEERAARRFRLSVPVERGLVLAGATSVAVAVATAARLVQPADWIGRLTVAGTQALSAAKNFLVGLGGALTHLDWVARLIATLSDAARTVLASSAEPLMALSLVSIALTTLVAVWLKKTERGIREGGLRHVPYLP